VTGGEVYECDPFSPSSQGVVRPALGVFNHEAAAVDPVFEQIYETEDRSDGLLYRFTPAVYPDLTAGTLEAAEILDPGGDGAIAPNQVRPLAWHVVSNPSPSGGGVQNAAHLPVAERATRYQVPQATVFNGGEGCWFQGGLVYFSTKGDTRVWVLNTVDDTVEMVYDHATSSDPVLTNVDNVYATAVGDVYVAEDPGNLQIVALTPSGAVKPIVQVTGQTGTEIAGPALSPDGTRLFFSSQRNPGTTYQVTGPFAPVPSVPLFGGAWRALFATALGATAAYRLRRGAMEG
jgi:secreted PhoX family phosphatase